ncbi:MAG: hypothetical protein AMXMBFR33_21740 [Candidatus Xenobia bacterium]
MNPEHRQADARDEDFFHSGPVFIEERYASSPNQFYRVVNSLGQVRSYLGHWLQQAAPVMGAMVPGPTLPVVGSVVRLNLEGLELPGRVEYFQTGPVVETISGHVASLRNAAGQTGHYNLSLLQRQARDSAMQATGTAIPGMGPLHLLIDQSETIAELNRLVGQSGDEQAMERVQKCLQHAPERAGGANLALKALQIPGGLALVEKLLETGDEKALQSAHHGLDLTRELAVSAEQTPWLLEVLSWDKGYASSRTILQSLLSVPEPERRLRSDVIKELLAPRLFESPTKTAERAVSQAGEVFSLDLPEESIRPFASFLGGWSETGTPLEAFQNSGLSEPEQRSAWQTYRDLGFSSKSALELVEFGRKLPEEELRQALASLAATGNYSSSSILIKDFRHLEKLTQSLPERLSLMGCVARLARLRSHSERYDFLPTLTMDFPDHEATTRDLEALPLTFGEGRVGPEQDTWKTVVTHRYKGESVAAAGQRLKELERDMPIRLDTSILATSFQWLSQQPREHYEAYKQALLTRLEAECPLVQAQSELDLARQAPEPVPQALKTLLALAEGELAEKGFRETLSWVYSQPPQDYADLAGRLIAQSKLNGSLERAMEVLERPATGVREEAGGVTFGGVRLKRRNPAG